MEVESPSIHRWIHFFLCVAIQLIAKDAFWLTMMPRKEIIIETQSCSFINDMSLWLTGLLSLMIAQHKQFTMVVASAGWKRSNTILRNVQSRCQCLLCHVLRIDYKHQGVIVGKTV